MFSVRTYSNTVLNLLIALAISIVVNFSYVLLLLVERNPENESSRHASDERAVVIEEQGRLSVSGDGHGYILYERDEIDSVYITSFRVSRLDLRDGDMMQVSALPAASDSPHAHMRFHKLLQLNGEPFDYSTLYNRPKEGWLFAMQIIYFFVVSFIVLTIMTWQTERKRYIQRGLISIVVTALLYLLVPVANWHTGEITMLIGSNNLLDYNMILKCSFALVVALLYGHIYSLISKQQEIVLENEHLKNENLSTRYNMLVSQISPHFFFNSLNSLAMLIREKDSQRALTYIDQLSYTFRYIIQNGQNSLSTLGEELKFAEAYSYLFRIRYADKLFFDINTDKKLDGWQLPSLTLQPLIGNAVKHNTITKSNPFRVSIYTDGEYLVVSNKKSPKLEPEPSSGIGLKNLNARYLLITGCAIEIIDSESDFTVRLPLMKPADK